MGRKNKKVSDSMKLYVNSEGHYFAVADGRVVAHDLMPSDAPDEIRNAPQCSRDELCSAIVAGLSQQLTDLAESLGRESGDRLVTMLCKFAESISTDLSTLIQAAEVERRQAEIYGEITRAKDDDQKSKLRAELASLPRIRRRDPARCGHEVVRPTQPPTLRARDVGERLGLSPDAVMRESIRGNLAKPTYQDGSPLWRESDVQQYLPRVGG
jgi:hypothetical protein